MAFYVPLRTATHHSPQALRIPVTFRPPSESMSTPFEEVDANPFQQDSDFNVTPSVDSLDLPKPSSPDAAGGGGFDNETTDLSATVNPSQTVTIPQGLPAIRTSFSPTHANANKSEFCCVRDQYLHSGDDVEILVGRQPFAVDL